jgi:2-C-methyl-D-erythritol 2,4-cyclodiphosphate synthase
LEQLQLEQLQLAQLQYLRIGFGSDTHRLIQNKERPLMLGGITIPTEEGWTLDGHSDADALLHALTDALLGTVAMGDIGQHFSDQNPENKGIDSKIMLLNVWQKIKEQYPNYLICNIDAVIHAQTPKMAPWNYLIQESIASLLDISIEQVSIKTKTGEKIGIIGRKEAIVTEVVLLAVIK